MSHSFTFSRQIAPLILNLQSSQQAPLAHCACAFNLQVTWSQQMSPFSKHSCAVPQSHSSPGARMPSPQTGPPNKVSGTLKRHVPSPRDNPSLSPFTLQLLKIVAGSRPTRALITHPLSELVAPHTQWGKSSSWYMPKMCPSSCANVLAVNAALIL